MSLHQHYAYTFTGLQSNTSYTFTIISKDAAQNWTLSQPLTIKTNTVTSLDLDGSENKLLENFIFYPNPVNDKLYLPLEMEWELYNIVGTKVSEGKSSTIDMSSNNAGIYIIKCQRLVYKIHKN